MIVVGGPNGAGKTTFIKKLVYTFGFPYIGADNIAVILRPEAPESAAIQAGREFILQTNEQIGKKESFIVETTLSGRSFANTIRTAKNAGFEIDETLVFVESPNMSVQRVSERVRAGGHHVPTEDVQRRFSRSLANFWRLYRPLADRWSIVYNGRTGKIDVAQSTTDGFKVNDRTTYDLFFKLAGLIDNDREEPQ